MPSSRTLARERRIEQLKQIQSCALELLMLDKQDLEKLSALELQKVKGKLEEMARMAKGL